MNNLQFLNDAGGIMGGLAFSGGKGGGRRSRAGQVLPINSSRVKLLCHCLYLQPKTPEKEGGAGSWGVTRYNLSPTQGEADESVEKILT